MWDELWKNLALLVCRLIGIHPGSFRINDHPRDTEVPVVDQGLHRGVYPYLPQLERRNHGNNLQGLLRAQTQWIQTQESRRRQQLEAAARQAMSNTLNLFPDANSSSAVTLPGKFPFHNGSSVPSLALPSLQASTPSQPSNPGMAASSSTSSLPYRRPRRFKAAARNAGPGRRGVARKGVDVVHSPLMHLRAEGWRGIDSSTAEAQSLGPSASLDSLHGGSAFLGEGLASAASLETLQMPSDVLGPPWNSMAGGSSMASSTHKAEFGSSSSLLKVSLRLVDDDKTVNHALQAFEVMDEREALKKGPSLSALETAGKVAAVSVLETSFSDTGALRVKPLDDAMAQVPCAISFLASWLSLLPPHLFTASPLLCPTPSALRH